MRYADRITFVSLVEGRGYNPDTGNYDENTQVLDTQACNLSSLGIDRTIQLFGKMDKEIMVARLQRPYEKPFDHALIKGVKYFATQHAAHRMESAFYLEAIR